MTSTSTPGKPKAIQTAKLETPAAYLTPKIQERQIKKRKAAANSSPNEEAAKIGNPNKRVIDRLCMQISKLGRIVGETYHPKKELKSVAESLASLTA
jgi:regulator of replication initiation timing